MSLRTLSLFLLSSAVVTATKQLTPCCAFNGDGAAFAFGIGTLTFPATSGSPSYTSQVPISIGTSGVVPAPFVIVAVDPVTSPEDSLMGWSISQNLTAQTLTAWTNFSGNPQCFTASVPLPGYYTPGFGLCTAGVDATLFQYFNFSYSLGNFNANLCSQLTSRNEVSSYMSFSDDGACAPLSLSAANTPFNTGAFSLNILGGEPVAPKWTVPSYCQ